MPSDFEVEPIAGSLGAAVTGIDLAARADADPVAALLAEHRVLFFRCQELDPPALLGLARRLGNPVEYPFTRSLRGYPEITPVIKEPEQKLNFGGVWHRDQIYSAQPPKATLLYALEVPSTGGDTLFADTVGPYRRLSAKLQETLAELEAVHRSDLPQVSATRGADAASQASDVGEALESTHPVVLRHPESDEPSLYLSPAHTVRFAGMRRRESRPLLAFLYHRICDPANTCRWRWRAGDLAIWDNRTTLHYPLNDYPGQRREMRRISIG